jgi:hypothetical protein
LSEKIQRSKNPSFRAETQGRGERQTDFHVFDVLSQENPVLHPAYTRIEKITPILTQRRQGARNYKQHLSDIFLQFFAPLREDRGMFCSGMPQENGGTTHTKSVFHKRVGCSCILRGPASLRGNLGSCSSMFASGSVQLKTP